MPSGSEAPLVAVVGRGAAVARAAVAAWDAGEAVMPVDAALPPAGCAELLDAMRPTHLIDEDGDRRALGGGVPVAGGVAAVVVTSGTTGAPKGVELTHDGLVAMARGVSERIGASPADRWLACVPMHRVAGLAIVARASATGVPYVAHDGFHVANVARSVHDEHTTIVSLVPTGLRRLRSAHAPLDAYRVILVGGAACPAELRAPNVVTTYGMTETWGGFALDGVPVDGAEVRVAGDGEICVRGPMVMRGYRFGDALPDDGWFRTGDVGTFVDGVVTVTDRKKDIVISGGVNVSPTRVERVLAQHRAIADVCVVGAPDPEYDERVVAVVVPRDASTPPSLDDLRAFAREHLTPPELPREIRVVDAIPRDSGGKVLRRLLRV